MSLFSWHSTQSNSATSTHETKHQHQHHHHHQQQQRQLFEHEVRQQLTTITQSLRKLEENSERTLTGIGNIDTKLGVQQQLFIELLRNPRSDPVVWLVRTLICLFVVGLMMWWWLRL